MNKIVYILVYSFLSFGCQNVKQDKTKANILVPNNNTAYSQQRETINKEKKVETISKKDSIRVYEQSEVDTRAVFPLSNAQIIEFIDNHFKYPDIEPITGRGEVELIIDEEGNVVDVLVVKSLHPEIDKEYVRMMKLLPKFIQPGKVKGKPVYSKYRLPISAKAF